LLNRSLTPNAPPLADRCHCAVGFLVRSVSSRSRTRISSRFFGCFLPMVGWSEMGRGCGITSLENVWPAISFVFGFLELEIFIPSTYNPIWVSPGRSNPHEMTHLHPSGVALVSPNCEYFGCLCQTSTKNCLWSFRCVVVPAELPWLDPFRSQVILVYRRQALHKIGFLLRHATRVGLPRDLVIVSRWSQKSPVFVFVTFTMTTTKNRMTCC
jgi:hypothetical protein